VIRVGSANFNNRSMGLDSECYLTIDTALDGNHSAGAQIQVMFHDLLAEHTGHPADQLRNLVRATGFYIAVIDQLSGSGCGVVRFRPDEANSIESKLAESGVLAPQSGAEAFKPMAGNGLLKRLGGAWHRVRSALLLNLRRCRLARRPWPLRSPAPVRAT
jgi:hypothetical protein